MDGKTFRPDLWVTAQEETSWQRSQVQTFVYDRPDKSNWTAGNIVVRDCLMPWGSQVIWQKRCTVETYNDVSGEACRFVDEYCAGIVYKKYVQLIGE